MASRPPSVVNLAASVQRKVALRAQDKRRGSASSRGYDADWRRCRAAFLFAHPLCRFCEEADQVTAATVADHIISIQERPDLRLDWGNLRPLCKECHDRRTARDQAFGGRAARWPEWLRPSAVPLTLVCGPPASGKTSLVRDRAGQGDLILDLDAIAAEMSGLRPHSWGSDWLAPALRERNELLGRLSRQPCTWPAAWLIVSEPKAERRQWWWSTMRPAQIIVLETSAEVCMARTRADAERAERRGVWDTAIIRWWSRYDRRPGDTVIIDRG